ncbi:HAUS augmin-like complex subunit 7 [Nematolebias whitei]|uniref:HAUS augmin-like complex subunit 7 n=1 Tax=Nematolebias whitei TaxID=451745 RepID=UPI00189BE037|nr:HAUS augmin-like complex subunit 7 [Nematolebias whitei]
MAALLTEKQFAHEVYDALQAVSCPLVQDLYLQEEESMLDLLCSPSELRTDILTWICCSINPNFGNSKATSARSKDPDALVKEMAAFGHDLMLSKADDLDLIRGNASPLRQLQFLEQLLTLFPGWKKSAGNRTNGEALLNELFAAENLQNLTQMLRPTLDPWPAQLKALRKGTKSSNKPREEFADVAAALQSTQTELKELQSKCDFLNDDSQTPSVFSPCSLRLAACDLQQLMTTFSHVYDSDMKPYCNREPPSFSSDTELFQRVHQQLLACNTELEMLQEASEASVSVRDDVKQLQTRPLYWSRGEKRTLPDQLEQISQRIRNFSSQLDS